MVKWLFNLIGYALLATPWLAASPLGAGAAATDVRLERITVNQTQMPVMQKARETLTIVSLNIAHGRSTSLNQVFVSTDQTKKNLQQIADFLSKKNASIVALQEADSPSWWSGDFHHVAYLAQQGKYPQYIHASHAHIGIGNYGTGILSRLPIRRGFALTFPPSPPTTRKGYTLAEIEWHTRARTVIVDVVSVHLDFSRSSVRKQQLKSMQTSLSARNHPLIIMGDFNSEWVAGQLIKADSVGSKTLHSYFGHVDNLATYKNKRLDWILVSKALVIDSYEVSPQELSDHLAVVATIRLVSGMDKTR